MIPELQTDRLLLRPLELADAEQTQRLFPHWEIVKHLNVSFRGPTPPMERSPTIATWRFPQSNAETNGTGLCD